MNSRERILSAINHQEADRLPIDLGSMKSTGLSAISFNKLKKELNFSDPCLVYDFVQQLAFTGENLRERFHVDSMDVGEAFIGNLDENWKPWTLPDGSPCLIPNYVDARILNEKGDIGVFDQSGIQLGVQPKGSLYVDQVYYPYGDLENIPEEVHFEDYRKTIWGVPTLPFNLDILNSPSDRELFTKTIKAYRKKTDKALMLCVGQSFFENCGFIRRQEKFLMDIVLDKQGVIRLLNDLEENYLQVLEVIVNSVGEDIDVFQFGGDDLGSQHELMISPRTVRELLIPHYRKVWKFVHERSKAKVFLHSCGSIRRVLGDLVEAGLDIINPVQTTAARMDPQELKDEFGKDLVFWGGGCDTQHILPNGTVQEVEEDVKRRIDIFAPGGGFVFSQIHNIQANVPTENIQAMFRTAYEYGKY
jgi:uroporphyrinogen decarboxylase